MTKFVAGGVLIGALISFGVITLGQAFGNAIGYHSENTIAAENDILRGQVKLFSFRVSTLEYKAKHLTEGADQLRVIFDGSTMVNDTITRFTNAKREIRLGPLTPAREKFPPFVSTRGSMQSIQHF
jgi:hypothetical protein